MVYCWLGSKEQEETRKSNEAPDLYWWYRAYADVLETLKPPTSS
jgi:hypothetical protein